MEPSQACLDLIRSFEGCRLTAYRDSGGLWSIGYGHLLNQNLDHTGETITQAQADAYMQSDVRECAHTVSHLTSGIPLSQNQFGACVSFAYNVGTGRFENSGLLRKLRRCDFQGASEEFLKWNQAAGRALAGLTRRREAERQMFLGGTDGP